MYNVVDSVFLAVYSWCLRFYTRYSIALRILGMIWFGVNFVSSFFYGIWNTSCSITRYTICFVVCIVPLVGQGLVSLYLSNLWCCMHWTLLSMVSYLAVWWFSLLLLGFVECTVWLILSFCLYVNVSWVSIPFLVDGILTFAFLCEFCINLLSWILKFIVWSYDLFSVFCILCVFFTYPLP